MVRTVEEWLFSSPRSRRRLMKEVFWGPFKDERNDKKVLLVAMWKGKVVMRKSLTSIRKRV
jgi:hypothetical protein